MRLFCGKAQGYEAAAAGRRAAAPHIGMHSAGVDFQEAGSRSFDERSTERLAAVHVVTAAEAAAGNFSIEDVVLPLPGGKVQYPQHETAQVTTSARPPHGACILFLTLMWACRVVCS